ncbi:MAG: hypothetical protein JWM58_2549 [Rhizobium sp.]|nr:hypothetical protein [Rhizobium sp.]
MRAILRFIRPIRVPNALGLCRAAAFMAVMAGNPASADDIHVAPVIKFFNANVRNWLSNPLIITSLKNQNATTVRLTKPEIDAMDTEWRNEIDSAAHPMIDKVMSTPLSHFLLDKENQADGAITEIIVMDARGCNAGQSSVSTDYWQGDEDKYMKSFMAGPAAIFVDAVRMDESTQMLQSQVSMTIVDEHNQPIGAITVGINLDQL